MDKHAKVNFVIAMCCMFIFISIHILILLEITPSSYNLTLFAMLAFVTYLPTSTIFLKRILDQHKKEKQIISDKMKALNVSNMIAIYNSDGELIRANENFCASLEMSFEEMYGNSYKTFATVNPPLWKVLLKGQHLKILFQEMQKKDLSYMYVNTTYSPIKSPTGKVYQVIQIANDVTDDYITKKELIDKNTYLEHAAKILRHDMHSGINTYIPRGVKSLERRLSILPKEQLDKLNLENPIKLIKEGLAHSQKVYKGVKEFTNLVRKDAEIEKQPYDLREILKEYLTQTSYSDQVRIDNLPTISVNEPLFCTAIDNLIRNGLKYNDSASKIVIVTMVDDQHLAVIDNGRGMTQEAFNRLCQPYQRNPYQKEKGTGLGLNICVAILTEHDFSVSVDDSYCEQGTCILIRIKK